MPRRDGTGPAGMGSKTGRGMGVCSTNEIEETTRGLGLGLGRRRGLGRNFRGNGFNNTVNVENQKDLLSEEKAILEDRLNSVNNKLNTLSDVYPR